MSGMTTKIFFFVLFVVSLNVRFIECVRTEPKLVEIVEGNDSYEITFKSEYVDDVAICR